MFVIHSVTLLNIFILSAQVLHFHEPLAVYASRALYWKRQPLRVLSLFDGIGTGV